MPGTSEYIICQRVVNHPKGTILGILQDRAPLKPIESGVSNELRKVRAKMQYRFQVTITEI
jgi:hypothetical protein